MECRAASTRACSPTRSVASIATRCFARDAAVFYAPRTASCGGPACSAFLRCCRRDGRRPWRLPAGAPETRGDVRAAPAELRYHRRSMQPSTPEPYISIIITGRNDDFGGDFNGRLFRALEFNHEHLAERGIAHEFVLVEWRPIAGKPWLAEVLADRYAELMPDVLTSYVADAAYHEAFSLNPKLQFQEFIAKNIGIRRCRGAFILTTNTDIYLSRRVLDLFAQQALQPRVLYRAERIDLKDDIDSDRMDWSILEDDR